MKITVEITEAGWDEDGRAASFEDNIAHRAAQALVREMDAEKRGRITASIEALAKERFAPLIDEALTAPLHKTNQWGEHTGKPTTLREQLQEGFTAYLQQQVRIVQSAKGPPTIEVPTYGRDGTCTRMQALVTIAASEVVNDTLANVIADTVKDLRERVLAEARPAIEAAVAKIVSLPTRESLT